MLILRKKIESFEIPKCFSLKKIKMLCKKKLGKIPIVSFFFTKDSQIYMSNLTLETFVIEKCNLNNSNCALIKCFFIYIQVDMKTFLKKFQ